MRTSILAGLVVATFVVAGCAGPVATAPASNAPATSASSGPSTNSGDQSVVEACNALGTTMEKATATLNESAQLVASDPKKAIAALTSFNTALETSVTAVSNPQVKAQGEKSVAATKALIAAVNEMADNPAKADATKLTAALTAMSTEITAIGTVCAG